MRQVYLIGIGMGNTDTLTVRAHNLIAQSDCLIGAKRMIEAVEGIARPDAQRFASIKSEEIVQLAESCPEQSVISVLLSGDVGFFSGAKKLTGALQQLKDVAVEQVAGISSLQYFCAKLQTSWDDAAVVSVHGREGKVTSALRRSGKVFVLTGSNETAAQVCQKLCAEGLEDAQVAVGERLSYPDERITRGTARQLAAHSFDSLAVMLLEAPASASLPYPAIGLADALFLRSTEGKPVPMTKQEVRAVAVSQLHLAPDACVYDVGAGTGSVTVEAALLCRGGRVFAIERDSAAIAQLRKNIEQFGLRNVCVVEGMAPEAMEDLPAPDAAFIGGSSGNLDAIVRLILKKNPRARIVVTAITLETVSSLLQTARELEGMELSVCQLSAARAKAIGKSRQMHLMMGQNPVFIGLLAPKEGPECTRLA